MKVPLLMDFFLREGKLDENIVKTIISKAKVILGKAIFNVEHEPNLVNINSPVTVIGDIHGQYYDLVSMLKRNQIPPI